MIIRHFKKSKGGEAIATSPHLKSALGKCSYVNQIVVIIRILIFFTLIFIVQHVYRSYDYLINNKLIKKFKKINNKLFIYFGSITINLCICYQKWKFYKENILSDSPSPKLRKFDCNRSTNLKKF